MVFENVFIDIILIVIIALLMIAPIKIIAFLRKTEKKIKIANVSIFLDPEKSIGREIVKNIMKWTENPLLLIIEIPLFIWLFLMVETFRPIGTLALGLLFLFLIVSIYHLFKKGVRGFLQKMISAISIILGFGYGIWGVITLFALPIQTAETILETTEVIGKVEGGILLLLITYMVYSIVLFILAGGSIKIKK